MKVAVLCKDGYEEIEALSVVDVLRRANVDCVLIGMDYLQVTSNHNISVMMDQCFDEADTSTWDMVVLPGGMPGAKYLKEDPRVIALLQKMNAEHKWIGAICAAPIVLQAANLLTNKIVTCFPDFKEELIGAKITDNLVSVDDNIITSRGPATALLFAYTILEQLGIDSQPLQDGMQYLALLKNS
jgi:4-methyl-5(b-hydroxyethyl)-thiazole monophosphate biosynthesis